MGQAGFNLGKLPWHFACPLAELCIPWIMPGYALCSLPPHQVPPDMDTPGLGPPPHQDTHQNQDLLTLVALEIFPQGSLISRAPGARPLGPCINLPLPPVPLFNLEVRQKIVNWADNGSLFIRVVHLRSSQQEDKTYASGIIRKKKSSY